MDKSRNVVLGILTLTAISGPILAGPTRAADRYVTSAHKTRVYQALPERLFTYPYGASYLRRTRPVVGVPYVNPYYGSYYASVDYYNYWAYHASPYWNFYSSSPYGISGCLQPYCR